MHVLQISIIVLFRNIDYLQAQGSGIVYCISCAAGLLGEIADAQAARIDQVAVSLVHTAAIILLGCIGDLISGFYDPVILRNSVLFPTPCLISAREDKDQPDLRIGFPQSQNRLRGQRIKAERAAAAEITVALFDGFDHGLFKSLCDFSPGQKRYVSMSRKTSCTILN